MKADVLALWCAALRSGEFPQGRDGFLRDEGDRYCPYGVLCEVHRRETGADERSWERRASGEYSYLGLAGFPTRAVQNWAGLNPHALFIGMTAHGKVYGPIYANDTLGLNFGEIADLLEKAAT